jgi:hypothetical protein
MKRDDELDPEEAQLRRRIGRQVEPQYAPAATAAPVPAAPFEQAGTIDHPLPQRGPMGDPVTGPANFEEAANRGSGPFAAPVRASTAASSKLPPTPAASAGQYEPGPYADFPMPPVSSGTTRPPAAPQTAYNRALEDQWLHFISQHYSTGASPNGAGFLGGGNAHRGNLQPVVDAFNQQTGGQARVVGEDMVDFGYGPVDVVTASGDWWMQQPAGTGGAGGGSGGSGGDGGTPSFAGGGAGANGGLSDFQAQVRAMILEELAKAQTPVDPNDPTLVASMDAARNEGSRMSTLERNALAERGYAQGGLNTGMVGQQIQQSAERNAVGLGGLRATLMTRLYENKRSQLASLLQMATASGDAESARAIQWQMAQLNATIQRERMGLDAGMFEANLNQNTANAGGGF